MSTAPRPEGAPAHGTVAHLLPPAYKRMVAAWLDEDAPSFDYGGFVVGDQPGHARLLGKSEGVLAGVPFFDEVFAQLDCVVEWHLDEGAAVAPIAHCATVHGPVRKLLLGERVALNALARCSGIATQSASTLARLRRAGFTKTLAGTRKTTPGFRLVEKYGMLVGGADPHRHDLSAMVMLKDNHIAARRGDGRAGPGGEDNTEAIHAAVDAAKAAAGFAVKVEVECAEVIDAHAAVDAGADVVMLDNFGPEDARAAASELRRAWAGRAQFIIEVSGGLTADNMEQYATADIDVLSTSSIHQGVPHLDFSLKLVKAK